MRDVYWATVDRFISAVLMFLSYIPVQVTTSRCTKCMLMFLSYIPVQVTTSRCTKCMLNVLVVCCERTVLLKHAESLPGNGIEWVQGGGGVIEGRGSGGLGRVGLERGMMGKRLPKPTIIVHYSIGLCDKSTFYHLYFGLKRVMIIHLYSIFCLLPLLPVPVHVCKCGPFGKSKEAKYCHNSFLQIFM